MSVSTLGYLQKSDSYGTLTCENLAVTGTVVNKAANATTSVASDAVTILAAKIAAKFLQVGTGAGGGYGLALDTGAHISALFVNATAGYMFDLVCQEVGGQTCTLAGGVGTTLVFNSSADIGANKMCVLKFICTGADTWLVMKIE